MKRAGNGVRRKELVGGGVSRKRRMDMYWQCR